MRLRKTLFILPNLFTLSSVFCGLYAILLCAQDDPTANLRAAWLVVFSMLFDTLDGRVARLTRTQSAFGVELDSLADIVSFGVAPAILWFHWTLYALGPAGMFLAFVFVACGAVRLARFNVMSTSHDGAPRKPSKFIRGLPIPVAAGVLVCLVIANHASSGGVNNESAILGGVIGILSLLMVSSIRFRSFKNLELTWRTALVLVLIAGTTGILALRFHPAVALIWILSSYVLVGLLESVVRLSRSGVRRMQKRDDDSKPRYSLH